MGRLILTLILNFGKFILNRSALVSIILRPELIGLTFLLQHMRCVPADAIPGVKFNFIVASLFHTRSLE